MNIVEYSVTLKTTLCATSAKSSLLSFGSYLQNIRWAHVNLGYDDKDGDAEGEGQSQMLFRHADDSGVGSDHEHT